MPVKRARSQTLQPLIQTKTIPPRLMLTPMRRTAALLAEEKAASRARGSETRARLTHRKTTALPLAEEEAAPKAPHHVVEKP